MTRYLLAFLILGSGASSLGAETAEYELTIARGTVNVTGTPAAAMTLNGEIPGPTLRFNEGDLARIHVRNEMDVETSIHWHGVLVPPEMDGVPYVSFPPIAPHSTFTYEFPIRQSGTFWYHSHTMLQEQRGVYGPIVISPRQGEADPSDRDHVVLLSDWTDTEPRAILRTLRRGSEWYAVERGTGQSILGAARAGRLRDYWARELRRMPAMDIADVAYDRFLANGTVESRLEAESGETVRLRLIDGSATTYFHVEFSGGPMTVITADGIEVEPFETHRLLIGVAETYDVLIRIPERGSYELRATAHDASGFSSVWLGTGEKHPAPAVPYPDLYRTMGGMTSSRVFAWTPAGAMGMPDSAVEAGRFDAPGMNMGGDEHMAHGSMEHDTMDGEAMHHGGMGDHGGSQGSRRQGDGGKDHDAVDSGAMKQDDLTQEGHGAPGHQGGLSAEAEQGSMDHGDEEHRDRGHEGHELVNESGGAAGPAPEGKAYGRSFGWLETDLASRGALAADGMSPERPWSPYAKLRARTSTALDPEMPVREIRLTLDGDMERYVWFLNRKPLSESDEIEIKEGEVTRFIMINRTMMHHPMHLHGHFFRVVNGQGDFSPLKHTVNVEPMSTTVIEFEANEVGDWFFHCHLLYHMKSGMARVVSYESFLPSPEVRALRPQLYREHWSSWGEAALMSHRSEGSVVTANTRSVLMAEWELGWQQVAGSEGEVAVTWNRYLNRFLSYFGGLDIEGTDESVDDPRAVAGIRYLLPFNVEWMLWLDSEGEARVRLEETFHLTPRLSITGEVEYDTFERWEGLGRISYRVNQRFDLLAHWHSDNGFGGGLAVRF